MLRMQGEVRAELQALLKAALSHPRPTPSSDSKGQLLSCSYRVSGICTAFCHAMVGHASCHFFSAVASDDGQRRREAPTLLLGQPFDKADFAEGEVAAEEEEVPLAELFERWVALRSAAQQVVLKPPDHGRGGADFPTEAELDDSPSVRELLDSLTPAQKSRSPPAHVSTYDSLNSVWLLGRSALKLLADSDRRAVLTWTTGERREFLALAQNLALSIQLKVPGLFSHFCAACLSWCEKMRFVILDWDTA
eukprot:s1318_g16.t1